jgi:hypothetical protein
MDKACVQIKIASYEKTVVAQDAAALTRMPKDESDHCA